MIRLANISWWGGRLSIVIRGHKRQCLRLLGGKVDGLAWALVLVLLLSLVSAACQVGVANALRRSAAAGQSPLPNPLPAPN